MRNIADRGKMNALFLPLRFYQIGRFVDAFLQMHGVQLQFHPAAFDTAHFQHVIHDIQQLMARFFNF